MPLSVRYSAASREARAIGIRLLDLSSGYEDLIVPRETAVVQLTVLGIVARTRTLFRAAQLLADAGDATGAAILTRAMTESLITLGWLNRDPQLAILVWGIDELRSTLSHHKEVADEERRERSRLRRSGSPSPPLDPGASHGLLTRANVRAFRRQERELRATVLALPRLEARKRRLMIKRISRLPTFGERAKAARMPWAYSIAYRFESNAAAHPTPLLIDQFIEGTAEGFRILVSADGDRPDPYLTSAQLMWAVLAVAGELIDHSELQPRLDEAQRALERLRRPG